MNKLDLGFCEKDFSEFVGGDCLHLADDAPDLPDTYRAQVFDPARHNFNPLTTTGLSDIDCYRRRTSFVETIDLLFPRGDSTLTKDTGLEFIAQRLEENPDTLRDLIPKPDRASTPAHIWAYNRIQRILRSPVLSQVFCRPKQFDFSGVVLARINRAELTDFDALVLGLFLINRCKGQIIIPAGEFYLRETHVNLVREDRLITGITSFASVPLHIRDALITVPDKYAALALYEDALIVANRHSHMRPSQHGHIDAVSDAMSLGGYRVALDHPL